MRIGTAVNDDYLRGYEDAVRRYGPRRGVAWGAIVTGLVFGVIVTLVIWVLAG